MGETVNVEKIVNNEIIETINDNTHSQTLDKTGYIENVTTQMNHEANESTSQIDIHHPDKETIIINSLTVK